MELGKAPYKGFKVYKVLHKNGRYYAILTLKGPFREYSVSWARYVLETSLGRKLKKGYQAHHIDEDFTNDNVNNLEEKEAFKHYKDHNSNKLCKFIIIDCPGVRQRVYSFI